MHDIIFGTYFVECEGELFGPFGAGEVAGFRATMDCLGLVGRVVRG